MRGASVHLAPLGGVGIGIAQLSRYGTFMLNAIVLPSGDHRKFDGASVRRVICDVAPSASIHLTKICEPPGSPRAMYAMRVPSGDHCTSPPSVSARFFVPSTFIIQSDDSQRSFSLSIQRRV